MTTFWSAWVIALIVINLGITFFLFLWGPRVEIPTQPDGTTGHVWAHGVLREGLHRLPTWWIVISALMFASGFAYLALYPGFGASKGILGWTSAGEHAEDTAANAALEAPIRARVASQPIETLATDAEVRRIGERMFVDNCASCHGRQGHGIAALGAPNLTDGDWLYGGDGKAILTSILDGRQGGMPAFAGVLPDESIADVIQYVRSLSGRPHDGLRAQVGKPIFKANCAVCHGADGKGSTAVGAPNLTDATWLYGGEQAQLLHTVRGGRTGVMPAWRGRLSDDDARMIAAYVYSLSHPDATRR